MAEEKRHIIEHKDGRSYSVTRDGFKEVYEPQGFKITGEETPAAFLPVGSPAPKRARSRPSTKRPARDRSSATRAIGGALPTSPAEDVVDARATVPDADGG